MNKSMSKALVVSLLTAGCWSTAALGQSDERGAFISHEWSLGGSVSSVRFDANGAPVVVQNLALPDPGAINISISPNGRWLAMGHGTSNDDFEPLTIVEVFADGTMQLVDVFDTPNAPLDVQWVSDELLAVTKTSFGGQNQVRLYWWIFDDANPNLFLADAVETGSFTTELTLHPNGQYLYASDSGGGNTIYAYEVDFVNRDLILIEAQPIPGNFPLDLEVSSDGTLLYSAAGISGTGNDIIGLTIAPDGSLTPLAGSPFTSPGNSPAHIAISPEFPILFAGHGSDATVWSFLIDDESGALTSTGNSFDVGLQGSIGGVSVLEELLLVTDETTAIDGVRGLYSFTVNSDGSFTQNGPIVDTLGVVPNEIAVWVPPADPCAGDLTGDSITDFDDFSALVNCWNQPCGDLTGDGTTDFDDFSVIVNDWNCGL